MSSVTRRARATAGERPRQVRDWLPAVIVLVATIAIWEGAIAAFDIQKFLLPTPTDIGGTLWDEHGTRSGRPAGTRSRRRSAAS